MTDLDAPRPSSAPVRAAAAVTGPDDDQPDSTGPGDIEPGNTGPGSTGLDAAVRDGAASTESVGGEPTSPADASALVDVDARTTSPPARIDLRRAATIGVGVALGFLLFEGSTAIIARLQGLLVTLLISVFLSFAMEPAVQWMAARDIRRGIGTALVFLATFLLLGGFVAAMAPLVVDQVTSLVDAGPSLLDDLADQAEGLLPGDSGQGVVDFIERQQQDLPNRVPDLAGTIGSRALGLGSTVVGGLIQMLTVLLVTFYLVADGPKLRRVLSSRMPPARQRELLGVWELAVAKTGGYVYSRVLTAVASAVFHITVFSVIGLEYAAALGVWVGIVSSLIPVVGTYLAGALPLLVALADEPIAGLWVLLAIVVYQQVENYLVAPRITAATMELHPAVAFISVLVGAALLGAVGALLALPAAAIVAALASAYGERYEVDHHTTLTGDAGGR